MPLRYCPHCQTQNFYTRGRVRLAAKVPLVCWKCGRSVAGQEGRKRARKSALQGEKERREFS